MGSMEGIEGPPITRKRASLMKNASTTLKLNNIIRMVITRYRFPKLRHDHATQSLLLWLCYSVGCSDASGAQ